MDSRRQLQVSSVMQEAFSDILIREGKSIYGKAFVTLTKVKMTSDLGLARFYLSVYNSEAPDEIIEKFNERKSELKKKLVERLRNQLRVAPEIEFFRDETLEYAFHMEEVFKKIKEEDDKLKLAVSSGSKQQQPNTDSIGSPAKKDTKKVSPVKKKAPVKRKIK